MKLFKNKKGSILDVIFIIILLVFLGVISLIVYMVIDKFNTQIQGMAIMPAESKAGTAAIVGYMPTVVDNTFLFLTVGLAVVSISLAAMVRISKIFIIFYILSLIFVIFLSAVFSNIYQAMAENAEFVAYASQLVFTSRILNALPFITGIVGTIIAIVMFKSWDEGQ